MMVPLRHVVYYVNPQERKPQAQRDWLDLLQGRAHNVHEVDVCALSLLYLFSTRVSFTPFIFLKLLLLARRRRC